MTLLARELDDERLAQLERALPRVARDLAPGLRERCAQLAPLRDAGLVLVELN